MNLNSTIKWIKKNNRINIVINKKGTWIKNETKNEFWNETELWN